MMSNKLYLMEENKEINVEMRMIEIIRKDKGLDLVIGNDLVIDDNNANGV